MNYADLNTYLQNLLQDQAPSNDYTTILPAIIQDAENRIYREMDFLACRTANSNTAFTAGSRNFTIPTGSTTIIVLQGVSFITPSSVTDPSLGTRNVLEPATVDFIDWTWPTEGTTGSPEYWAQFNNAYIIVGPTPDEAYTVELTGIFRPAPMSASNQTSYIGSIYPDLLVAACMVFASGWQRDFGSQSDDPTKAMSWETLYQSRMKSALEEEQRRKGSSVGWSPFSSTLASPART